MFFELFFRTFNLHENNCFAFDDACFCFARFVHWRGCAMHTRKDKSLTRKRFFFASLLIFCDQLQVARQMHFLCVSVESAKRADYCHFKACALFVFFSDYAHYQPRARANRRVKAFCNLKKNKKTPFSANCLTLKFNFHILLCVWSRNYQ